MICPSAERLCSIYIYPSIIMGIHPSIIVSVSQLSLGYTLVRLPVQRRAGIYICTFNVYVLVFLFNSVIQPAVSHQCDSSRRARLLLWDTSISHGGGNRPSPAGAQPGSISFGSSSVYLIYGMQLKQSSVKAQSSFFFFFFKSSHANCITVTAVLFRWQQTLSCLDGWEGPPWEAFVVLVWVWLSF